MTVDDVVALLVRMYDGDYSERAPSARALELCGQLISEGVDERVVVAATDRVHASGWLGKPATQVTAQDVGELVAARPWKQLKTAPTWSTWFAVPCSVPVTDPVVPASERAGGQAYEFDHAADEPVQRSLFGGGS